uniref:Uncharacterized protein n=1 Tax=Medicago truncatula TaxID=3880 RepID=Q2HT44_MEDTR|nr:hypothetical protein MtrDRAFT_AC150798g5v2 [Medicago truncatula]
MSPTNFVSLSSQLLSYPNKRNRSSLLYFSLLNFSLTYFSLTKQKLKDNSL